jgi:hypothetical protein
MTRSEKLLLLLAGMAVLVAAVAFLGGRGTDSGVGASSSTVSVIPAVASATIIGLGSLAVAAYTQRQTYRQKTEENFFRALNWLTGGSQKRNIAIAAIEAYWYDERLRDLSIPLLTNSAIYLLLESKQRDAAHEINNLTRMMTLLLKVNPIGYEYRSQFTALLKAVTTAEERAEKRSTVKQEKGLQVDVDDLAKWRTTLGSRLGYPEQNVSAKVS